MKKTYLGILLFLSFALLFNACSGDSDNVNTGGSVDLTVKLEGGEKFNYQGGQFFLRITTTGSWKIEKPASDNWYSFSITSGHGNGTVVLKVTENSDIPRTSNFTVTAGTTKKSIEISQDKYEEELLYYPRKEAYRIEIPRLSKDVVDKKAAFVVHYAPDNYGDTQLNYLVHSVQQKQPFCLQHLSTNAESLFYMPLFWDSKATPLRIYLAKFRRSFLLCLQKQ